MSDSPKWTATITPSEMAVHMVEDLCKKFRQINSFRDDQAALIAEGLVDGLKGVSFPHPAGEPVPNYLKSMDANYCAGYDVGSTWRRIAQEWPVKDGGGE
jgi:hypothetical protein